MSAAHTWPTDPEIVELLEDAARAEGGQLLAVIECLSGLASDERSDATAYATGLALWRAGQHAKALEAWEDLSDAGAKAAGPALDQARIAHCEECVAEGRLSEAATTLEGLEAARRRQEPVQGSLPGSAGPSRDDAASPDGSPATQGRQPGIGTPSRPKVDHLWRAISLSALKQGDISTARRAAGHLSESGEGLDRALLAMTRPTRAERASALAAALEGARHRAPIRRWLQHRLAGELSLLGRFEDAVAVLDPADADCSSIRNLVGGLVGIGTSAPSRDAHHLEVAAWYGRRGDHDRAYEALAEAEAADAWNPTIIRTLAVLALIRAHRSLPTVDADAWRDFIAHVSVFLANPRWVGAFVLERLKVYGSDEPYDGFVDGTRQGAEQHAERVISNAIADAKGRGDEEAAAALSELHVELIRELMAARAVWDAEAAQVSSGAGKTRVGFGPLFAERVAGLEELRSYFVNSASEERRPPPDERLRALVRRFGIDLPDEGVAEDTDLRRWFSELSLANAHRAAGNWEAARRAALAVFVRYMPPADADRAEIERLNLGFAGLPDPAEALRQDAARLCSDVGVSALKASLSADVEVEQVSEMLRAAIGESVALGVESETRERLSRLLIGKDEQLAQRDSLAADSLATRLLKTALDTGIPGLEATYHRSLARYGYRLGNSGRHQDAADQYQAAWRAQPHDTQAGASWTFSLLMCAQEARDAGLTAEADRLLDRAREAVKSIKRSARDDEEVKNLERALQVVGWGVPLSEVVEIRSSPPPGLPEAPAAATGALERARELVAGRRFEEAAALLDGLGEHATHPRVLVQRAAVAVALAATAGPRHDAGAVGLEAYEALRRSLATSVSRHPNEPELCIANAELELHKPLWKADDPVSKLLAKGLRLRLKGRYAQAAELLKTVYALSPRRDSTLCLVLAQCLARAVSDGVDEGEDHLMTSRKLVKIAARRSPTHPLIAGVRSDIAWADGSPGGSE